MAITKPRKSLQKPKKIFDRLIERQERVDQKRQNPADLENYVALEDRITINREIFRKKLKKNYATYRESAKKIIPHTEHMLEQFSKDPKLKDGEFVFLDRDALPYMYIARELCEGYGFRREQFKKAILTNKAEEQISNSLKKYNVTTTNLITINSNGLEIQQIAKDIPNIAEIKNLKKIITETLDLTKPIVVIDTGIRGTAIKKYQILLKSINPKIKTYSAMFYASTFSKEYIDFLITKEHSIYINEIENTPKFNDKLLKTEDTGKRIALKRQRLDEPNQNLKGGFEDPVNASVFAMALRREIANYKKEKGIK
jgi:hypothetical protein